MPDDTNKIFELLTVDYDDASEAEHEFWKWVMTCLMPIVSKDWSDRLKGKRADFDVITGEELFHYLTLSDFAYIPLVVKVYGERELSPPADERKRGRTKGQSGMMSKENIAQYVDTAVRMKDILGDENNESNIRSWGDAIFAYIDSADMQHLARQQANRAASLIHDTDGKAYETNIRKQKKDEIVIPV